MSEYVRITDRKIELTDEAVEALMGEDTPTTEEVRLDYRERRVSRGEAFDRWLAEVKAQAWEEGFHAKWYDYSEKPEQGNPYRGENK